MFRYTRPITNISTNICSFSLLNFIKNDIKKRNFSSYSSSIPGFHSKSVFGRLSILQKEIGLTDEDVINLMGNFDENNKVVYKQKDIQNSWGLPLSSAVNMIENVIGTFQLPLGVATNFLINGRNVFVPMAVEEPSIIAAASKIAKIARSTGGFFCNTDEPIMIGQIHITNVSDPFSAKVKLSQHKDKLLELANTQDPKLLAVGGGAKDIKIRILESPKGPLVIVHLLVDCRDAMGANAINTMAEAIAPLIEKITDGKSNLAKYRLVRVRAKFPAKELDASRGKDIGIIHASNFAMVDPYRAATHNKGIFNGIDPILIATGNDWRAVEAGGHAYTALDGQYLPLTRWEADKDGDLVGSMELPMAVGLVGGAIKVHPAAKACVKILQIESASELAEIVAAVGLAQNLGALRALATEGIQKGHMALHAKNMISVAASQKKLNLSPEQFKEAVKLLVDTSKPTVDKAEKIVEKIVEKANKSFGVE